MPMLGGRGKIIDDKIWHWIYNKHCRSVPAGDFIYSNTIPDRVFIIFESTGEGGRGGYKLGYKLGSRRTKFWNEIRK